MWDPWMEPRFICARCLSVVPGYSTAPSVGWVRAGLGLVALVGGGVGLAASNVAVSSLLVVSAILVCSDPVRDEWRCNACYGEEVVPLNTPRARLLLAEASRAAPP